MKYIRLIKSKKVSLEDVNKLYEDKMRERGFPSDEQLHKEYESWLKNLSEQEKLDWLESRGSLPSFEEYKKSKLKQFDPIKEDVPEKNKEFVGDYWEDTDEDPIKDEE